MSSEDGEDQSNGDNDSSRTSGAGMGGPKPIQSLKL